MHSRVEHLFERWPALGRLGATLTRAAIPFIPQHTTTDCGPTCLAMVLAFNGREVRTDEIRAAMGCDRDGVNALAIVEAARMFGLRARGVKVTLEDLERVPRASILHWGFDHFLVLDRVEDGMVHLVDPAVGPRMVSLEEAGKRFTGVAILTEKAEGFVPAKAGRPLVRYLRRALGESKDWPRVLLLSGLLQVFGLALPLINGRLIDLVIPHNDGHMLLVLLVGLVSLIVFQFVTMFVRSHLLVNIRTILDAKMTLGFMDHMLALPYAFFQRRQTGDLMMRLNSNAQIREILTSGVASGAIDGVLVLAYLVLLLMMSVPVAMISVCLVGVQAVVFFYFRKRQILLSSGMQQKQAEGDSHLVELLSGIETLKATGHEQRAAQKWGNLYVDIMNLTMGRGRMSAWTDALLHVVSVMSPFIILVTGTLEVMKGHMTLGTMMSVSAFANGFISPVSNLVGTFWQFQIVGVYLARIEDVLGTPKEQTRTDLRTAPQLTGRITLTNVSFRYGPKAPLVVRDVSLDIAPGRVVAIVGSSGSGKSTLASLLCGLYTPSSGTIRYDGNDLNDLDLSSVRRQLGIVIQKPYVFGTSIRTNITMGDPNVSLDAVIEAAKVASIHDEVLAMPLGYDTPLTAGGASLSGGQRQRVALARALLRKPAIMLLDEATSALDNVTERRVKENLEKLGCTRVVIAHRLSTIRNADLILVMEDGKLVEQGTHAALLARGGAYARLIEAETGVETPAAAPQAAPNAPIALDERRRLKRNVG